MLAQDDGERHGDRPAPRPDVGDPDRRRAGIPWLRGQPADDLGRCDLDEALGFRSRDQGPLVDGKGKPVELLDPADVGHRLARGPPVDGCPEPGALVGAEHRLRVGEDRRPVDAQDVAEEQLGVQPRRRRPRGEQPVRPGAQDLLDRQGAGLRVTAGS